MIHYDSDPVPGILRKLDAVLELEGNNYTKAYRLILADTIANGVPTIDRAETILYIAGIKKRESAPSIGVLC